MRDHDWLYLLFQGALAEFAPSSLDRAAREVMRVHLGEVERLRLEWVQREQDWRSLQQAPILDVQQRSQIRQISAICQQLLER